MDRGKSDRVVCGSHPTLPGLCWYMDKTCGWLQFSPELHNQACSPPPLRHRLGIMSRLPRRLSLATTILGFAIMAHASEVRFEKLVLTHEYWADGINVADFDRDGHLDIVTGPYWYRGPDFRERLEIYPPVYVAPEVSPTSSLFSYPGDFNGDGWPDVLVIGRIKKHPARWYENPGKRGGPWIEHRVTDILVGESPPFVDVDGDGHPEIVTHVDGRWGWLSPDPSDPGAPWFFRPVTAQAKRIPFYHGTGIGDIDGDGRPDLVLHEGWFRQTGSPPAEWTEHPGPFGRAEGGAQMLVYDVDGDGRNDVVTAIDAHGWGLSWFRQLRSATGEITFEEHRMMGDRSEESQFGVAFSQPHAQCAADLDGDGLTDVITGKRRWAHGTDGDVEPDGTPVLYWFQLQRDQTGAHFVPHLIDDASGVGTQIVTADLDGDGIPDILTVSKLGAFVFFTRRQ